MLVRVSVRHLRSANIEQSLNLLQSGWLHQTLSTILRWKLATQLLQTSTLQEEIFPSLLQAPICWSSLVM